MHFFLRSEAEKLLDAVTEQFAWGMDDVAIVGACQKRRNELSPFKSLLFFSCILSTVITLSSDVFLGDDEGIRLDHHLRFISNQRRHFTALGPTSKKDVTTRGRPGQAQVISMVEIREREGRIGQKSDKQLQSKLTQSEIHHNITTEHITLLRYKFVGTGLRHLDMSRWFKIVAPQKLSTT